MAKLNNYSQKLNNYNIFHNLQQQFISDFSKTKRGSWQIPSFSLTKLTTN
jgi:hypothetical protein